MPKTTHALFVLILTLFACGGIAVSTSAAAESNSLSWPQVQATTTASAFFDWAERTYPGYFPGPQADRSLPSYVFRYYPSTEIYLAVAADLIYALGPVTDNQLLALGNLADFACRVNPDSCTVPIPLSAVPLQLGSGATLGMNAWSAGATNIGGHGTAIGGVSCLVAEDYHVHAHLAIIKDGEMLAVPPHIGLQGCAYELHTHDASGVIHVETQAYHRLTLGQFFAVWGQPLSPDNVAGIVGLPVSVYINDGTKALRYIGDPAEIELTAHREITIVIGSTPSQLPSYQWAAGM